LSLASRRVACHGRRQSHGAGDGKAGKCGWGGTLGASGGAIESPLQKAATAAQASGLPKPAVSAPSSPRVDAHRSAGEPIPRRPAGRRLGRRVGAGRGGMCEHAHAHHTASRAGKAWR